MATSATAPPAGDDTDPDSPSGRRADTGGRRGSPRRTGSRAPGVLAGLAGVAAAALAMGAASLLALLTGPGSVPVVAVGTAVIDVVPGWGKEVAVAVFGTSDKTALIVGTAVLLAAAAYGIGALARRRPVAGDVGIVLLAGIGAVAAGRPGAGGPGSIIPSLAAALVGVVALRRLLGAVNRVGRPAPDRGRYTRPGASRRGVLAGIGSVTAAGGALVLAGQAGQRLRFGSASARADLVLPAAASPAPAQPAGVDPGAGASPFLTPVEDFYRIDTALFVPSIDPAQWRLRVYGMVDRELDLDLTALLRRPLVERDITLTCVSNEVGGSLIGNARWLGVPLAPLLAEAGLAPGATQLVSRDGRGMTIGTPVATVTDGRDAMLAVGMNGAPLPFEHGFPVRMVVPGLYGYVSACKWITSIEVTTFEAYDAYWVQRGWAQRGPIKVSSRIDTPRSGASRDAGTVVVAGVAWDQHTGIARVEVRVDDGDWQQAELAPVAGADTWREWTWRWPATRGSHRLAVRATTADGQVQTDVEQGTVPDGATGLHSVTVDVG